MHFNFSTFTALILALVSAIANADSGSADDASKIVGFSPVTATVYRGGRPKNEDEMRFLVKKGIHTIINLQGIAAQFLPGEQKQQIEDAKEMAERLGLRFFHLPFSTVRKLNDTEKKTILEVIRVMEDPQMQPVYVHCNVGADRTGVVVAAFRILEQNCSYEKAHDELVDEGQFWTPLFTAAQMEFLQEMAANPGKFAPWHGKESCPL